MSDNTGYLDTLRLQHCKFHGPEWAFVSDSQDVASVKAHCDAIAAEFDAFFVKVGSWDERLWNEERWVYTKRIRVEDISAVEAARIVANGTAVVLNGGAA